MSHTVRIIGALSIAASTYMGLAAAREWHVRDIYGADEFLGSKILSEQKLDPRLSYKTTREALTRCITTRSSTWFTLISKSDRTAIDDNCQTFAAATQSIGAKHSEAHILLAGYEIQDGNFKQALHHIINSSSLAPVDRFLIEWRLILYHRLISNSAKGNMYYNCATDLDLLSRNYPSSVALIFLDKANSPILKQCAT
jgi:hypothetical protein